MKRGKILRNVVMVLLAAFLIVQLVDCSKDQPLNTNSPKDNSGNLNGRNDNPVPDQPDNRTLLEKFQDVNSDAIGQLSKSDLWLINPNLANLQANITIYAPKGRNAQQTRPVVILTESLFRQNIKNDVLRYIASLNKDQKDSAEPAKAVYIIIDGIEALPKPTKFQSRRFLIKENAQFEPVTIDSYAKLNDEGFNTFDDDGYKFGSIRYSDGNEDVYDNIRDQVGKALLILNKGDTYGFDGSQLKLIAFDPFMSAVITDESGENKLTFPNKIDEVLGVAPILLFEANGLVDNNYKNAKTLEHGIAAGKKRNYVFECLRRVKDTKANFFASLVGGKNVSLIEKYSRNKLEAKYYFITGDDSASVEQSLIKGEKLVLDDNVTGNTSGMKAIVIDPNNVESKSIQLANSDYNFPSTYSDIVRLISGDGGLLRKAIE